MRTPASIAGHPIHPMVVPIAIGGFILSFVFAIVCLASGSTDPWASVAYYTMIGGIVGALCAAVPGFIDMLSLPRGHTKNIALSHMGINLSVVVLFVVNAYLRHTHPDSLTVPMWLSFIGLALLVVSGWLGGHMVYEAGVGVDTTGEASKPAAPSATRRHLEA